jgi:hypothetical protein
MAAGTKALPKITEMGKGEEAKHVHPKLPHLLKIQLII